MRPVDLKSKILSLITALSVVILVLMPFHAFLTVWGSRLVGHYTLLRLWKEALLVVIIMAAIYLAIVYKDKLAKSLDKRLFRLILIYVFVNLIWGAVAYTHNDVNLKALGYALIINLRFVGFFLATWLITKHSHLLRDNWQRIILWPAAVVVIFGLMQVLILPHDFLKHFGYDVNLTIPPFETINSNSHYIRIMSTLRGANPLGAYLVIPISVLSVLILRGRRDWKKYLLLGGSLLTLFFSFSRSAWLGALISIAVILLISVRRLFKPQKFLYISGIILAMIIGFGFGLRHNLAVENVILHTQTNSTVKATSNEGHISALKSGLTDIVHQPLGRGPGSAGPASVYNSHPSRIAENYYIQIGQELGWIGLITFLLINFYLGYMLWLRRGDTLALSLFASLIGLSLINMLSHAWADDTLAYIWWGLAGVAIASSKGQADELVITKPV